MLGFDRTLMGGTAILVGWVDPPEADNIIDWAQPNLPNIGLFVQTLVRLI